MELGGVSASQPVTSQRSRAKVNAHTRAVAKPHAWPNVDTVLGMTSTPSDTGSIAIALLAVGATLFGALLSAGIQWWVSRSAGEAAGRALRLQLSEERFRTLWAARRELYPRVIASANRWHQINLDLAGTDLTLSTASVGTLEEARNEAPVAGRALEAMYAARLIWAEVDLLADSDVRAAYKAVYGLLKDEMAAATNKEPVEPWFGEAVALLTRVMRHELVRGHAHVVFGDDESLGATGTE